MDLSKTLLQESRLQTCKLTLTGKTRGQCKLSRTMQVISVSMRKIGYSVCP